MTLRGLNIDGVGRAGTYGIVIVGTANVYLEELAVMNFQVMGILDDRSTGGTFTFIKNSVIRNNGWGVSADSTPPSQVLLENVQSVGNGYGIEVNSGNRVVVSRSVMAGNVTAGIQADPGAQVFVDNTEIAGNHFGIYNFGTAVTALANSDIAFNTTGISGNTASFGNNRITLNTSAGTTPTVGPASTDHSQE